LGNTLCWIRFFPALFGALTLIVVWKAIEALKGNTFALILGATCVLLSALLRLNGLYQPNSLDALCWTTFCYILILYANSEYPKWFYYGMVVLAFGFLNKYNIVFLLAGLLPALLLTKRSVFNDKNFYISILLFLLLIFPNLLWQYNNNFPVYHHMQQLAKIQLVNVNRWDFLKEQLFFFVGSLLVIFASFYALLFYTPFKKYRFFFWTLCFTLMLFTYLKATKIYIVEKKHRLDLQAICKIGHQKFYKLCRVCKPYYFFQMKLPNSH
jgi:4-amino-4-deoxy-L-arabinose transferase-like glycosyltransferase